MESSRPAVAFEGRTYLELARLPHLFTAAVDVLAGYWIANEVRIDSRLFWLLLATSAVYAAGYALNDFCARGIDPRERPGRPIPSERVEPWKDLILSLSLFTIGLGASALAGGAAPLIMVLLILATVLYTVGIKARAFLGPVNMAGCRSLNLILGMGLPFWLEGPGRYLPVYSFFYVFLVGCLSRFETEGKSGNLIVVALLGWVHFVTILLFLSFWEDLNLGNLPFFALFTAFTGPALLKAGQLQTPSAAEGALKRMALGIPLLDAIFCSGVQGFAAGVPIALCTVLAYFLPQPDFRFKDSEQQEGGGGVGMLTDLLASPAPREPQRVPGKIKN